MQLITQLRTLKWANIQIRCFKHRFFLFYFLKFFLITSLIHICQGSHYARCEECDHMSDFCNSTQKNVIKLEPNSNKTAIMIKLKRESYKPNMNCTIHLSVPPKYGLMAFVTKLKMRRYNSKADYIEFFSDSHSLIRFYGVNQEMAPSKTIMTSSEQNIMMIRFVSESYYYPLAGKGFKIIANIFAPINQNDECDENLGLHMNCRNQLCIDSILECDGIDNCRNDIDESQCDENSETKLSLFVFLATLGVLFMLVIMFLLKNKDRRKEIVCKMSQAYANNHPILYAMENNGSDSPLDSSCDSSPNLDLNVQGQFQKPLRPIRSQLSMSLPQGMEKLHNGFE